MLRLKPFNQYGDTIVEVLLAVAILGFVVAIGYSTASAGLRATRQAQEHSEALKIAEGQVERLKAAAVANPSSVFGGDADFCLKPDATVGAITPPSPTATGTLDDFSRYSADCRLTLENQPCDASGSYCYYAGIRRVSGNTFTVTVKWDGLGNSQQDEVKINYRLYDGS